MIKERLWVLALAVGALALFYVLFFPKPQPELNSSALPLSSESRPEGYLAVWRWLAEQRIPTASLRYRYDRLPALLSKPTGNLLLLSMPQRVPARAAETAALEKWKTFATLYPDYFQASGAYAFFAWQNANRYDEAIQLLTKTAVAQNPNRGISDYNLGALYVVKERYADALASFERADQLGSAQHKEYYASAYAAQRQFEKAASTLTSGSASGLPTEDIDVFITRATFAADEGRFDGAAATIAAATREAAQLGAKKGAHFKAIELVLRELSTPAQELLPDLRALLAEQAVKLRATDDADRADTEFRVLLVAYFAAHLNDAKLADEALSKDLSLARSGGYPTLDQMLKIAEAERARLGGDNEKAIGEMKALVASGTELCLVHVALMDALAAAGQNAAALEEAKWLASHRGRAYIEANMSRLLTLPNVVQSDLALLRAAELAAATGAKEESARYLAQFRAAWPNAGDLSFIRPRLAALATRTPAG